ncbi:MAG: hypothetical protein RL441_893 [Actinomycetota bacterium]
MAPRCDGVGGLYGWICVDGRADRVYFDPSCRGGGLRVLGIAARVGNCHTRAPLDDWRDCAQR